MQAIARGNEGASLKIVGEGGRIHSIHRDICEQRQVVEIHTNAVEGFD